MTKLHNTKTGEVVEAIGCWLNPGFGLGFLSGQNHNLLDYDSPVQLIPDQMNIWDDISEEAYDYYQLPTNWKIVANQ